MQDDFVKAMAAHQDITLPAGHLPGLAAHAALLAKVAATLESRLDFGNDIHAFQDFLKSRSEGGR